MIPNQSKNTIEARIPTQHSTQSNGIIFSFQALEYNEYFNLDATCANWATDLFKTLHDISSIPKLELLQGKCATCRIHSHENAKPPCPVPQNVNLKDFYQIRISTSKGGIHGVFVENVFYIMWLDPLHNMYPSDRFGGLRKIQPPSTCCRVEEQKWEELENQITQLKKENETYQELFEEKAKLKH